MRRGEERASKAGKDNLPIVVGTIRNTKRTIEVSAYDCVCTASALVYANGISTH